jgi:hypothetical protein
MSQKVVRLTARSGGVLHARRSISCRERHFIPACALQVDDVCAYQQGPSVVLSTNLTNSLHGAGSFLRS